MTIFGAIGATKLDSNYPTAHYPTVNEYAPTETKVIKMKVSPVEQRRRVDFFSDNTFEQRSQTVYYLVAEDGMVAEVGLSDFAEYEVGDSYSSNKWVRK